MSSQSIKVIYGHTARRIPLASVDEWDDFERLRTHFPAISDPAEEFKLSYVDEDGDTIVLDTIYELADVVTYIRTFRLVVGDDLMFPQDMDDVMSVVTSATTTKSVAPDGVETSLPSDASVAAAAAPLPSVPVPAAEAEAETEWNQIVVQARGIISDVFSAVTTAHPDICDRVTTLKRTIKSRVKSDVRSSMRHVVDNADTYAANASHTVGDWTRAAPHGFAVLFPILIAAMLLPCRMLRLLILALTATATMGRTRAWHSRWLWAIAASIVLPGPWWLWLGLFVWTRMHGCARWRKKCGRKAGGVSSAAEDEARPPTGCSHCSCGSAAPGQDERHEHRRTNRGRRHWWLY